VTVATEEDAGEPVDFGDAIPRDDASSESS
jgi:hypothetical protein